MSVAEFARIQPVPKDLNFCKFSYGTDKPAAIQLHSLQSVHSSSVWEMEYLRRNVPDAKDSSRR